MRTLRKAFSDALLAGDESAAEVAIRAALGFGMSPGEIDVELIAPALWLVGELWERGEITVADEHVATEITVRVLVLQRELLRTERRRPAHRVLLAALEGERHVVGLRMAADLLAVAGFEIRYLGADVPLAALGDAAERQAPDVVCVSMTMPSEPLLWRTIELLAAERPETPVLIGGRGVAEDFPERPRVVTCRVVTEVVGAVDALVRGARLN